MSSPIDYAWAAGFVDGEGYISISKNGPWTGIRRSGKSAGKVRRERGGYYFVQLTVVNRNPAPMQRLVDTFGGHLRYRTQTRKSAIWQWRLQTQSAVTALEAMLPFFVGKADLAKLCISFHQWYQSSRDAGRSMSPARRNQAEAYYLECRRLLRLFNAYSAVGKKHNSPAALAEVVLLQTGTARE